MTEFNQQSDSEATTSADLDAAVAARLERLAARRSAPSPRPIPPATSGGGVPAYASKASRPTKPKRRHAAAGARQAALALSLATTGGLTYAMSLAPAATASSAAQPAGIVSTGVSATSSTPAASTNASSTSAAATATPSAAATSTAATSTAATSTPIVVNGDTFSNRFGDVQVQATVAPDGTLTSVTTLQTPDGDGKSVRINDIAVPTLNSEALSVQSANVDTVSGATYTSNDYRRSLQSAIDTARASGLIATQ